MRTLAIGDTMPDITLTNVYNYPVSKIRLSDLKGKLVVLDFWATWCGACIESFPKLNDLQNEFGNSLQLLLVNVGANDDERKVTAFFKGLQKRTGFSGKLPYILNDTVLKTLFTYQYIPHVVWIGPGRKVLAITGKEAVHSKNIYAAIHQKSFDFKMKNDELAYSPKKELITDSFLFRSLLTPAYSDLGSVAGTKLSGGNKVNKLFAINHPLYALIQMAWPEISNFPSNRIMVEKPAIDLQSIYCYEIITPPVTEDKIVSYMQQDLSRYFNIRVYVEYRKMTCYILTTDTSKSKTKTKGKVPESDIDKSSLRKYISNQNPDALTSFLSVLLQAPVINETNLLENIDMEFPANIYELNREELKSYLSGTGFNLTTQEREIEVAVISSNQP